MILEDKLKRHVDDLISRYPKLKEIEQQIIDAYLVLEECYSHNGRCGAYCRRVNEKI